MKYLFKSKLIIIILLFISMGTVKAQKENLWQTYFPTNPNQAEWKEISTHKEMTEVLNINKTSLNIITTSELLEIYLQYPLLLDIWAFNNLQTGFISVKENFNGLQELLQRKDLKDIAIEKYSKALLQKDTFDIHFTQLLLSQKEIISVLNIDDINKLSILTSEFIKQQINSKDYSLFGISVSTYLISHLVNFGYNEKYMNKIGEEQKEKVLYFFNNCNIPTVNIINVILNETINVTISETKDSWVTIYTPNGSPVNAYQRDSEPLGWWARWRAKRSVINNYPNATIKRDATGKYNCHSYAWYSRATSNNKWINAYNAYDDYGNCYFENLHKYWNDGSYYQVSSSGYGKLASYGTCGDDDHSAKWITSNKVVSKWGQGCLVEHNYDYCPYNSSNITNYKRYIEPIFSCSITGPIKATNSGTYTWYSHVSNGTASSYLWKYSYDGNNYFGTFGTTQNVTAQMPLDNDLFLKLIVTSTNNEQAIAYHATINMSNWHKAYPNPVKDILTIEIDKNEMPKNMKTEPVEIRLYDKMMSLIRKTTFKGDATTINVSNLKPDIYILQIIIGNEIFEEKIIVSDK